MSVGTGSIRRDELEKLFHIDVENLGARQVPLLMVYDPDYDGEYYREDWDEDSSWYHWFPTGDELTRLRTASLQEGSYLAREPEGDNDVYYEFLNFFTQHASWAGVMETVKRIEEDIRNLGTSLAKFATYQHLNSVNDPGYSRFVKTELEYIFIVCRSLYDLLQKVACQMWDAVELQEGQWSQLPERSFAKIALQGPEQNPVPAEQLREDYGLTPSLAQFYEDEAENFRRIRDFRVDVVHYGKSVQIIFPTEDGYAIRTQDEPFDQFDSWDEGDIEENGLASLWPPVAEVMQQTLAAMNNFVFAFTDQIAVRPEVAPGYNVYLRGPHIHNLAHLSSLMEDDIWAHNFTEMVVDEL